MLSVGLFQIYSIYLLIIKKKSPGGATTLLTASSWDQYQDVVISDFISGVPGSLIVTKNHLWHCCFFPLDFQYLILPIGESHERDNLGEWRGVPILKRSQFMKGHDIKALINGLYRSPTRRRDWFDRWYCYWRSTDVLGSVNRGRMLEFKEGNSIGFVSVRLGGWTVMGDPTDPYRVKRTCQCETGLKCRLQREYYIMVNSCLAGRQQSDSLSRPTSFYYGMDGWMNGILMRWSRQAYPRGGGVH